MCVISHPGVEPKLRAAPGGGNTGPWRIVHGRLVGCRSARRIHCPASARETEGPGRRVSRRVACFQEPGLDLQSKRLSRRVVNDHHDHHDLDNEFFLAILDSRMQYSCGYWQNAKSLDEEQSTFGGYDRTSDTVRQLEPHTSANGRSEPIPSERREARAVPPGIGRHRRHREVR